MLKCLLRNTGCPRAINCIIAVCSTRAVLANQLLDHMHACSGDDPLHDEDRG